MGIWRRNVLHHQFWFLITLMTNLPIFLCSLIILLYMLFLPIILLKIIHFLGRMHMFLPIILFKVPVIYFFRAYASKPPEGILMNCLGVVIVTLISLVIYIVTRPEYKREPSPDEEHIELVNWLRTSIPGLVVMKCCNTCSKMPFWAFIFLLLILAMLCLHFLGDYSTVVDNFPD